MTDLLDKETDFSNMIDARLSRRSFLMGTAAMGAGAFLALNPVAKAIAANMDSKLLNFMQVPASTSDTVIVPKGYSTSNLMSWGDPIFANAPAFNANGKQDSTAQTMQFGDNTDGMSVFPLSKDHAILAVNNEYTNYQYLFDHQGKAMTADDVKKAQAALGVTVVELVRKDGKWIMDPKGKVNRRITANTEMHVTGPAAGHDLLKTKADPTGKKVLGTINNCSNGHTPWGTYLTCEENFNGFFGAEENVALDDNYKRYGIEATQSKYQWHNFDERFDLG